jgi:hypothetical protein
VKKRSKTGRGKRLPKTRKPQAPSVDLTDPAVMLETLHLAYLQTLDLIRCFPAADFKELMEPALVTEDQAMELGRRLGAYWKMAMPSRDASLCAGCGGAQR